MSVLKLYNADAYKNNTLIMHDSKSGCCGPENEFCKYKVEGTITNVTDITLMIDENPVVVLFEEAANTTKEIRKAIAKALMDNGYDPYYEDAWKGIKVTDTEICLVGEMVPTEINIDGTQEAFSKSCETGRVCKLRGMVDYDTDAGLLSYNGSAGTQIGTTDGFAAGDIAPVMTALETALNAEGVEFAKLEVEEQASYGAYVYTIHTIDNPEIMVGGSALTSCGCYPDFIFA